MMVSDVDLDRNSSVPLHVQVEQFLRRAVHSAEYRGGKLLPPEVFLASKLQVSRNTVRAAMARLESEGLLTRVPKIGTRVASKSPHTSLAEWYSFSGEMARQGVLVQNFELAIRQRAADRRTAAGLGVEVGTPVWRLRRVRGWDGHPVVLALSWLHPRLGVTGREDFGRPLYEVIRDISDAVPAVSREEISIDRADADQAESLDVAVGDPLLLRSRVIVDAAGQVIEFNLNFYRSDRYRLTLDLGTSTSPRRR